MLRSNSKSLMNHVVSPEEKKRNAAEGRICSGVAMGCPGCAMHKDPRGLQWTQFFCFPTQNVVKSTEIYGFLHVITEQLC